MIPVVSELTDELVAWGHTDLTEGRVLIDTGAQVSLLRRGASAAPMRKPDVVLRSISGRQFRAHGRQEVELKLDPDVKIKGDYVVCNLPRGYLAVLGCDILKKGLAKLDMDGDKLTWKGRRVWLNRFRKGEAAATAERSLPTPNGQEDPCPQNPLPPPSEREDPKPCYVYSSTRTVLPARSEMLLQVKLGYGGLRGRQIGDNVDMLVEPVDMAIQGVRLARSLTTLRSNRCWVQAVNVSFEDIPIDKNQKLGTAEESPPLETLCSDHQRIHIRADSHGRGLQALLAERLPSSCTPTAQFFPNGRMTHIMNGIGPELERLGERDTMVVIGGTNDVDQGLCRTRDLQMALSQLPSTWKCHLVFLSIPHRYDRNLSRQIQQANATLEARVNALAAECRGPVTWVDDWGLRGSQHYTRHGLHLNEAGKITLVNTLKNKLNIGSSQGHFVRRLTASKPDTLAKELNNKLSHLPADVKERVREVLLKFRGVIAHDENSPLGCTSAVKHTVNTGNAAPIYKKAYRVPHHRKALLEEMVQDQLKKGVVRPSNSPWASPVVLVPKKSEDGTPKWRFCVDFRAVNEVTVPDVYPLPNITETLDSLGGCTIFTTLDLRSGYHQIEIDESSKAKTAFNVPGGHYEYNRMPFGLSSAPATFQRLMDSVLSGLKGEKCLVYLDDIIVYSRDLASHLTALTGVFTRLQEANLCVQLSKCNFLVDQVKYLGHVIDRTGVRPDPGKLSAVNSFPKPTTVRDVRAFLGLAGYYRRHVKGFSTIGKPLFDLTKQGVDFIWTPGCQSAFDRLKMALTTAPVLAFPDFRKPFILATDASTHALGAVLSQEIDGREHPVAYASRTLQPAEKNYTTTELELLSLVWSTKHFRCYLLGREFKVVTDHAALKWLLSLKDPSSRLTRWTIRLSEFKYTVEHKPGRKHTNADGLSRSVHAVSKQAELPIVDLSTVREHQKTDDTCQQLRQGKNFKFSPEKVLYKINKGNKVIVVPETLVPEVIRLHHDIPTAGHAGAAKTLDRIKTKFWWRKMDKDVADYVHTCRSCSQKTDYGKTKAPLGPIFNEPKVPFEVIATDIVGPLPVSESGNKYILSVMDHFTRYSEFIPLPDQTAETVARALVHRIITKFGVPKSIVTDQGTNFTSGLITQMCKLLHVRKVRTTGFHPQSNGRVERVHATIMRMLSHFVNKYQTNWDEYLPYVTMAYNSQGHESLGYSPYELLFGRKMEMPLEADFTINDDTQIYNDHVEALRAKLDEAYTVAAENKTKARKRNEKQYNAKAITRDYYVGQSVWLHVPSLKRNRVKKLSQMWQGPYLITEVLSPLTVRLKKGRKDVVVHVNRIKPCLMRGVAPLRPDEINAPQPEPAGPIKAPAEAPQSNGLSEVQEARELNKMLFEENLQLQEEISLLGRLRKLRGDDEDEPTVVSSGEGTLSVAPASEQGREEAPAPAANELEAEELDESNVSSGSAAEELDESNVSSGSADMEIEPEESVEDAVAECEPGTVGLPTPVRRSGRNRRAPSRYQDYQMN